MKFRSCCPKCDKPQARWEFFEPFPRFANQCKGCGAHYVSSKSSFFIGAFIGLVVAGSLISADKDIITWQAAVIVTFVLLATMVYASPYLTTLVELNEPDRNIINKWMRPFFRWQIFITIFVILLILANAFTLAMSKESLNVCCIQEKIAKIESAEKLKLIIQSENNFFMSFSKLYKSLLELNVSISISVFFLLMFNLIFYFKILDFYSNNVEKG